MQIEALKIFCDVARLRSFSRAAAENRVTQSTASQTVHHLEEHLGVTLIERSPRPLRLTTEGTAFFSGCREIVERYQDLELVVKRRGLEADAEVRVAAIYSFRSLPTCIRRRACTSSISTPIGCVSG